MKGGFLEKAIDKEAATKPKKETPGLRDWDEDTLETTAKVFQDILDENNRMALNDLERRLRTGTGVREFRGRCCGAPDVPVPGEEEDVAARALRETTRLTSLREMVAPIMEQTAEIFGRVQAKGMGDGLVMDAETECKVLRDIVKESLIRHILKVINTDNSGGYASGSHDAGLLATPQGYYGGDLESFDGDTIRGLMERGYGVQDEFMDSKTVDSIWGELELLDYDGKLVEVQQQKLTGHRSDRILWLNYDALDREKQPGLVKLTKKMISIPFELNKKCSLYLQASANFQVACYPAKGYYKRHVDGGYDGLNNGRKVTAVFYANRAWDREDGGQLRMYRRVPNPFQTARARSNGEDVPKEGTYEVEEDIEPLGGRLVLFRSRDMPHEVMLCKKKRFALSLWLMGPPGPGDQPDDHHTPT